MSTNYASVRFYKQAIALASISLLSSIGTAAELQEETDIKFAFYSSAWGAPTDDGMRLIVYNQTRENLRLDSIEFLKDEQTADPILIETNLDIPPLGYAEEEF